MEKGQTPENVIPSEVTALEAKTMWSLAGAPELSIRPAEDAEEVLAKEVYIIFVFVSIRR
jgi:hypothetical protein